MSNAAQNDLRDKLEFETLFASQMADYFNDVANSFLELSRIGVILNVRQRFDDRLIALLKSHYERVEKPFSHRVRNVLPFDVASTFEEDREISNELLSYNDIRSQIQSRNINTTTQKDINDAMDQAGSF